jgi:hypothetical protein
MAHSSFNPKSRWDRHIPETQEDRNPSELNERIEVFAWFRNGKIQPTIFIWNNKEYKIKNITYSWQERRGKELINYFSVNTGTDLYQISFNNTTFSWRIDKIIN